MKPAVIRHLDCQERNEGFSRATFFSLLSLSRKIRWRLTKELDFFDIANPLTKKGAKGEQNLALSRLNFDLFLHTLHKIVAQKNAELQQNDAIIVLFTVFFPPARFIGLLQRRPCRRMRVVYIYMYKRTALPNASLVYMSDRKKRESDKYRSPHSCVSSSSGLCIISSIT